METDPLDAETPEGPATARLVDLVAALFAEEHALLRWAATSHHPRLADAYRSLHEKVTERCRSVRTACAEDEALRRRLLDATLGAHEAAMSIEFELSRLKWLLANRRDRGTHGAIPGHAAHADDEAREAEALQMLLHQLARGVC